MGKKKNFILRAGFEPATYGFQHPTTVHRSTNWAIEGLRWRFPQIGKINIARIPRGCSSYTHFFAHQTHDARDRIVETERLLPTRWKHLNNKLEGFKPFHTVHLHILHSQAQFFSDGFRVWEAKSSNYLCLPPTGIQIVILLRHVDDEEIVRQ